MYQNLLSTINTSCDFGRQVNNLKIQQLFKTLYSFMKQNANITGYIS